MEENTAKIKAPKERKPKKVLTKEEKKKRAVKGLVIFGIIVLVIALLFGTFAIVNVTGVNALMNMGSDYAQVSYAEGEQLAPVKGDDGFWTFTADRQLKVMQFTDVHIGAGFGSQKKDGWAMNAVAAMITAEKPDLVIVTGDIAYPVPFQAGTFNNLNATKIFSNLMEHLGVYWTFCFGNHDTEAYSYYTRDEICDYYEAQNYKYCLFQRGFCNEERGYGNSLIKVANTSGVVTQALVTLDSHSYTDGDAFGALWKYDNIHKSQVDWYAGEIAKINAANKTVNADAQDVKSLSFFHIPLREYRYAWSKYIDNGRKDFASETESVKVIYGDVGESNKENSTKEMTYGVYAGVNDGKDGERLIARASELGLVGTFCGHDHLNNFSLNYTYTDSHGKSNTVRMTYGKSIDYLAYVGIWKEKAQRGCTVISIDTADGSFDCVAESYYQDKYEAKYYKQ